MNGEHGPTDRRCYIVVCCRFRSEVEFLRLLQVHVDCDVGAQVRPFRTRVVSVDEPFLGIQGLQMRRFRVFHRA